MKTSQSALMEEMAEDFTQYLKAGADKFFNVSAFSRDIDPNLNIDEIEKLLRVHFVLTHEEEDDRAGVIDFVRKLPERVRRIKTTVSHHKKTFRGEVRGRISWKDTIASRYAQNPRNKGLFVCSQREKNYDIDENLVLKKLLQIIHSVVFGELEYAIENNYGWVGNWVSDEEHLRSMLERIFHRNVYLRRIDLSEITVTERMISNAKSSRHPLYREAAHLLTRYRKLMNYEFDQEEARELLRNTFIQPQKTEVLFELYWVIRIIKWYEGEYEPENISFKIIEPEESVIARWECGGHTYTIWHDSTGQSRFSESLSDIADTTDGEDNYIGRHVKALEKVQEMVNTGDESLWGGRPDILLEKAGPDGKVQEMLVGEVKYTDNDDYVIQGLRELIEYMGLIRHGEEYVEAYDNLFSDLDRIRGCLFVDSYDDIDLIEDDSIKAIRFEKAESLPEIIKMIEK